MRDYGKVAPTFWTRGSGKNLRGDPQAQVVALYLFTAPSASMTGLYYLPLPTMCHETGLAAGAVRASLRRLQELGIAFYDENDGLVWVPEMAKYQIAAVLKADDKRVKGIRREVETFRGHRFFLAFVAKYGAAYCLGIDGASEGEEPVCTPSEAPPKPLRSQDIYAPAPERAPARVPAPEGGAGGHTPAVRLGSADAPARRPSERNGTTSLAGPEAQVIHEAMSSEASLASVATPALANRIAGEILGSGKPVAEVVESIRAASKVAGDRFAANAPMSQPELVSLVCGYAEKPRPRSRDSGPRRGRDAKQPETAVPGWIAAEDTPP